MKPSKKIRNTLSTPTRRQFLGILGGAGLGAMMPNPLSVLIDGIVDGAVAKAHAQAAGSNPRNFVHINLPGGAPRWYWDLPLTPYGNPANIIRNAGVNTRFKDFGTDLGEAEYATTVISRKGQTLNMPSLWATRIPTVGGLFVPMAELMDHMLIIRGVNLGNDGHPESNMKQTRPVPSAPSFDGAIADLSSAPVPTVSLPGGAATNYKSMKSVGQIQIPYHYQTMERILGAFNGPADALPANYVTRRDALDVAIKKALSSLGQYSKSSSPGAENLYAAQSSIEKLVKAGIGDANTVVASLMAKYKKLEEICLSDAITGITDKAVSAARFKTNAKGGIPALAWEPGKFLTNTDLRTLIRASNSVSRDLAQNFAIAEYLVTQKLSSSITLGCSGVINIKVDGVAAMDNPASVGAGIADAGYGFDEHFQGVGVSIMINSYFYRTFSSMLYEFISVLKASSQFNETVIQVSGDFGRSPRHDQMGSDHAGIANSISVFSGAIQSPLVVGNIFRDDRRLGENYLGTWGVSAPVKVDGANQDLTVGHQSSTVAHLLRVKPMLPNNGSLVIESGGKIEPTVLLAEEKG